MVVVKHHDVLVSTSEETEDMTSTSICASRLGFWDLANVGYSTCTMHLANVTRVPGTNIPHH